MTNKPQKFKKIVVLIILIMFLGNITNSIISIEQTNQNKTSKPRILNYSIHEPISIISNQNFTDYGFPGTGTIANPYRIDNYFINTTEEKGIEVKNVSESFIIQNCFVIASKYGIYIDVAPGNSYVIRSNECTKCWDGIYITQGGSASIINNICYLNSNYGIRAYDVYDYITIAGNNCSYNERGLVVHKIRDAEVYENFCIYNIFEGITIWETDAKAYRNICNYNNDGITTRITPPTQIYNNTCNNNIDNGIRLSGASDSIVSNNICKKNGNGIYNIESFHLKILNNTCNYNDYGLFFDIGSWYGSISNNNCSNNSQAGIALAPCWLSTITNNEIHNNQGYGIYLERSLECTITNNSIQNNDNYGIFLDITTNKTIVAYNYFINNNLSGTSQGYDAGKKNMWFDEENKAGNHWSDHTERGKYKIDGSSESVDKYPLNEYLERTTYSQILLIGFSLIIVSFLWIKRKTNRRR